MAQRKVMEAWGVLSCIKRVLLQQFAGLSSHHLDAQKPYKARAQQTSARLRR